MEPIFILAPILVTFGIFLYLVYFHPQSQKRKTKSLEQQIEELKKTKTRLESSINSIHVGFIITDQKGEILSINSAAKRILCQGKGVNHNLRINDPGLVNLSCSIDDIAKELTQVIDIKQQIQVCLEKKLPIDWEVVEYKNLILRMVINPVVSIKRVGQLDLEFIGTVIVVEDITEEKILDRSKNELFSIASHELKTPLTVVKGNTEIIKKYYSEALNDTRLAKIIEDIHESSIYLIDIVDDFLDLSRLEQGRIKFKPETFDLTKLIQSIVKEYESIAVEKGLDLNLGGCEDCQIEADPTRVRQVFVNLLGNALKFTHQGEVRIDIEKAGDWAKVIVTDTGVGISEQNQQLVFRKFQQAGDDILTRETARGTGVGLYISKLLVEGMNGQIKLDKSVSGQGSRFSFSLPLASMAEK